MLLDKVTKFYGSSCSGDSTVPFESAADIDKDGYVTGIDLSIVSRHAYDETFCKAFLADTTDTCKITHYNNPPDTDACTGEVWQYQITAKDNQPDCATSVTYYCRGSYDAQTFNDGACHTASELQQKAITSCQSKKPENCNITSESLPECQKLDTLVQASQGSSCTVNAKNYSPTADLNKDGINDDKDMAIMKSFASSKNLNFGAAFCRNYSQINDNPCATQITPTLSPQNPNTIGDLNHDGKVDIFDNNILAEKFGKNECGNVADLNGDCKVNILDYNILLQHFTKIVIPPPLTPPVTLAPTAPSSLPSSISCSFSGPAKALVGTPVTYSATLTPQSGTVVRSMALNVAPITTGHLQNNWTAFCTTNASSCSKQYTFTQPGKYYVMVSAQDANFNSYSANPTYSNPELNSIAHRPFIQKDSCAVTVDVR